VKKSRTFHCPEDILKNNGTTKNETKQKRIIGHVIVSAEFLQHNISCS